MTRWTRVAVTFVAAAVLAGVAVYLYRERSPAFTREPTVRTYAVPPEIAREVHSVVQRILDTPTGRLGQVVLAPGGRLVVTAPAALQDGLDDAIADIAGRELPPTPAISFELWLVTATPGEPQAPRPAVLTELVPVLDSIDQSRGPMRFELLEKLSLLGRAGDDDSEVTGARARFRVKPTLRRSADDQTLVAAEIDLEFLTTVIRDQNSPQHPPSLRSDVELRPGELLVVGQSLSGNRQAPASEIYYVLRARL